MNERMVFHKTTATKNSEIKYFKPEESVLNTGLNLVSEPALSYGKALKKYSIPAAADFTTSEYKMLVPLRSLITKKLKEPILITLENDEDGFIAQTIDIPLYGYSAYPQEAIDNLKYEIESLYENLLEDDNFTAEWLKIKKILTSIIE